MSRYRRQRGFTLLEVLVSLIILGTGLVGLAFLQTRAMLFNTEAYSRSQASMLAYDIIDQIRFAPASAQAYNDATPAASCDPTTHSVANNIKCWNDRVGTTMPGGSGSVSVDGAGVVTVSLSWTERGASGPETHQATWTAEL